MPALKSALGLLNPMPPPTFEGLSPNRVYARNGLGPASMALVASGPERVEFRAFRTLDGAEKIYGPKPVL